MNTTLTVILAALLAGVAVTEFPETEELVRTETDRMRAAQTAHAEQLAEIHGLDLEGEAAFEYFYE